ncbi:MAG: hypothetical protein QGH83_05750, partial [Candidatus Pacebacteria bacterium]|nr:hypothetical protein [Candidatus Paceibacterota bacterium]
MAFINTNLRHVGTVALGGGGVWSVSGNTVAIGTSAIHSTHYSGGAGFGSQTDAIAFSWLVSEAYNGSTWATGPAIPTFSCGSQGALGHAGGSSSAGTASAGMAISGGNSFGYGGCPNVSEWNGTSWATGTSIPMGNGCRSSATAGTQTACYFASGNNGTGVGNSFSYNPNYVEWNGTAWATGGSLLSGRGFRLHAQSGPSGTQTAGLVVGGQWGQNNGQGGSANWGGANRTEEYDGTTSAYGANLNNHRAGHWQVGSQTNAYACFSSNTVAGSRVTEKYDGSTWSITAFAITAPAAAT